MLNDCWWAFDPEQPSTMVELWTKALPLLYPTWNNEHKNILTKACVGYITRSYNFYAMSRLIRDNNVPGTLQDWRHLRLCLLDNFRTALGLKLMLLRCQARACNNLRVKLMQELEANDLYLNDQMIYLSLKDMGLLNPIITTLNNIPNLTIPTTKMVQESCGQALSSINDWIDRFVSKKHAFIYKSNNFQHWDISGDLKWKATQAFYHVTPFLSDEHRISTAKRAAHNHGIKLIVYYTNPERARTRKKPSIPGTSQFENVVQTYTFDNSAAEVGSVRVGRSQANSDNILEIRRYINQHPNYVPILNLLLLRDDNDFIQKIEQQEKIKFISTEEVFDHLGRSKYHNAVAQHLLVPEKRIEKIVRHLQAILTF